ncbi:small nuclear ribonucleoprotein E-like [Marmota marmota marmota]|nr:small nuclear ribonucleoprotein E-like [Marmota marmota marmota]
MATQTAQTNASSCPLCAAGRGKVRAAAMCPPGQRLLRGFQVFAPLMQEQLGKHTISSLTAVAQNLIFRYLQNRSRIQVWLYEQVNMLIESCIIGFNEYMDLVLDDAEESHSKTKSRKQLGRIMLKGDNITLLQSVSN